MYISNYKIFHKEDLVETIKSEIYIYIITN